MPEVSDESVEQVLVMFKCHLDVGYTDSQANVLRDYHDTHLPRAVETAAHLRATGDDRYVWTVPAWLMYRHLHRGDRDARRLTVRAIEAGDLTWHALPFTWYTELLDESSIGASLGFSAWLDDEFGRRTTAARMTDVPGHTRGLVRPLAEAGVTFLDIGVNPGCKAPAVLSVPGVGLPPSDADEPDPDLVKWNESEPVHTDQGTPVAELRRLATEGMNSPATHLFRWREETGREVTVLYHTRSYGSTVRIPGLPLAVSMRVHGDNTGPHSLGSIRHAYSTLRRKFPNANVRAASLTEIGDAVAASPVVLPVETREIGDSWIYGTGSDPHKTSELREVVRMRSGWIADGQLVAGSPTDLALLEELIPAPEHNWGLSTSVYLRSWHGYDVDELARARATEAPFQVVDAEWETKRQTPREALSTLPEALADEARRALNAMHEPAPATMGDATSPITLDNGLVRCEVDQRTGALGTVQDLRSGTEWAGEAGMALFSYVGYDTADYQRFSRDYNHSAFAANDFGKPGLERYGVAHLDWRPDGTSVGPWRTGVAVELHRGEAQDDGCTAWPSRVVVGYEAVPDEAALDIRLWIQGKAANRRPEALWLSFDLKESSEGEWRIDKVGQSIDPMDVVEDGGRRLHGIGSGVSYADARGGVHIDSLDAHLVSPGERGLLRFDHDPLRRGGGMHFALYNNLWGTAFPQWYGADMEFRFRLTLTGDSAGGSHS